MPIPPHLERPESHGNYSDSSADDNPLPSYYDELTHLGKDLLTNTQIHSDGRIDLSVALATDLPDLPSDHARPVAEFAVDSNWRRERPPMNIVIMIVGSRGDVQPYVALGKRLKQDGHRVRIATHEAFRKFVTDEKLEFFDIGGDPHDLMSYMVKNPGLMPGLQSLTNGDIIKKRAMLKEMIYGCWESCHATEHKTGKVFIADAIISNPPGFAHFHCAEALGIPLQMSFTMPWSPTTAFPHPLVNITSSNAKPGLTNYLTYYMADLLTWQGVGDVINKFRMRILNLEALDVRTGPGIVEDLKVPWTYCVSPALVPKPGDWKNNIDVVGFYFLDLATNYEPPTDLTKFLNAGEPPIYIGFGSVVVDDPRAMTKLIFEATSQAGVRALVSAGWGGLGGVEVPSHIFILGNIPHDWLFDKERVSAVVHHGGAGTTAIGLSKGRPTVVVPFFGDQGFWGSMIHRARAGPEPIPHKKLTVANLRDAIRYCIGHEAREAARKMAGQIISDNGVEKGVQSFYRHLPLLNMRCDLDGRRLAVWWSTRHCLKLSAFAAQTLIHAGLIDIDELDLHSESRSGYK
ncbi:glycosyltransferase family 1 protein [Macrolepiota fuliginosa MF-IS2]|uniref:Glycosyltransferase family 1 protein n=1 Tax=Macrolepiota fuliginosa MF-IS2 TaxID=1400762 RepID=A0A9P6C669_9AGAR|nr:glycosyltransferase family 1 protein [Macrolepiota fuliginosa MF-IS2]